ncbi:uncharacterized protein L3040_002670 [Drepanopeziza brunnea f. sp. 'multigermtubi']|uniref:Uncharacterized protein n=1 Tax=Marssonina brunnea f. sp. multigermtubi (strain MB_m1) TaxID=1072389 RepID=K1XEX2_MARBU|nr:uncharacterized protein MBM_02690 [Drepanopeziza brunnea f. sp. 'multigermtubi' MB_m1]EKD19453.1 hypothetical protein MBM_02690 [Drepanopeziza brunnea f. sp. 'multigermtubi' MB_m1]KAJ5050801.1 hypothetical protein L3040_002670 [Drepanopeziza brunnea f. sp. 'multigermtubi']
MESSSFSAFSDSGPPTPTTTVVGLFPGQRVGAVLAVKRTAAKFNPDGPEVGELVRVCSNFDTGCHVEILRSGRKVSVRWEIFFPLSPKGKCSCREGNCRCELAYPASHSLKPETEFTAQPIESTKPRDSPEVSDPSTLAGQLPGAILVVKHLISTIGEFHCKVEVGDHVEYLEGLPESPRVIRAKNLRTGAVGRMLWRSFFPLADREVCACFNLKKGMCPCIYLDFERSVKFVQNGI